MGLMGLQGVSGTLQRHFSREAKGLLGVSGGLKIVSVALIGYCKSQGQSRGFEGF